MHTDINCIYVYDGTEISKISVWCVYGWGGGVGKIHMIICLLGKQLTNWSFIVMIKLQIQQFYKNSFSSFYDGRGWAI